MLCPRVARWRHSALVWWAWRVSCYARALLIESTRLILAGLLALWRSSLPLTAALLLLLVVLARYTG